MSPWAAGADACKSGWCVAIRGDDGEPRVFVVQGTPDLLRLAALTKRPEPPARIVIDLPIGLPACASRGGRGCETAARAMVGARRSSVFSTPCRAALAATKFDDAKRINAASSSDDSGLTQQSFALFPRIRAVDALVTPDIQRDLLSEGHPECSFVEMNGGKPLRYSKQRYWGMRDRINLLHDVAGMKSVERLLESTLPGVGDDDVLDSLACLWTAERIVSGHAKAIPLGVPEERDERGLRMAIWI